jgi:DNA repair protein RecN (Recombination protein N)
MTWRARPNTNHACSKSTRCSTRPPIQLDEAASSARTRARRPGPRTPPRSTTSIAKLARLHDLARKHRVAPEGLAAQRDALSAELDALRGAEDRVRALDGEIESARIALGRNTPRR